MTDLIDLGIAAIRDGVSGGTFSAREVAAAFIASMENARQLNAMLAFVEQLQEVNVEGVEAMTSVTPMAMKMREDVVNDGEIAADIVKNAPATEDNFFLVPKVVE